MRHRDPSLWLSAENEAERYGLHQNRDDDEGYLKFLDPVLRIVTERVLNPARGLDFGSGPNPVLARLLTRAGYTMAVYDPFYAPDLATLTLEYDFITCTEAAEHFYDPGREFKRLFEGVRSRGSVVLLTLLCDDQTDFAKWHYSRDPTHVVFYSRASFEFLTQELGFSRCEIRGDRLIVLTK